MAEILTGRERKYRRNCHNCGRFFHVIHGFETVDVCPRCFLGLHDRCREVLGI